MRLAVLLRTRSTAAQFETAQFETAQFGTAATPAVSR
jgi:hypothetical protein